jgi:CheY-like chemotaxis protein
MQDNTHTQPNAGVAPFLRHGYIPFRGTVESRAVPFVSRRHDPARFFPLVPGAVPMSRSSTSSASSVTTAFLLVQSEDFAVIDRRALREAGIGQVRVITSGVYAARVLSGKEQHDLLAMPDIVLVHRQLADMTGAEFVELVRSHPRLAALPVLYVSSAETPEEKRNALAQGYSGLLVRP